MAIKTMKRRTLLRRLTPTLMGMMALPAIVCAANRYTNAENGWSLEPPAGWRMETGTERVAKPRVGWFGPTRDHYTVNLLSNSGPLQPNMNLKALIDGAKKSYAEDKQVSRVYGERTLKISGSDAWTVRISRKLPNGMEIEQRQMVGIKGERAVVLTYSMLASTKATFDGNFDKIIASFKWDK